MPESSDRARSKSTRPRPLTAAEHFGNALRRYRNRHKLTLRELEAVVNYSYSMLGRMETGKATPTMEGAAVIDAALNANGKLVILAAAARSEPFAGLPPATPHFVGREHALTTLTTLLIDETHVNRSTVAFIVGPPGVGKTALLRQWANTHQDKFNYVLHADLHGFGPREPAQAGGILEGLLRGLGVSDARIPTANDLRLAQLQGHLEKLDMFGQRVLIVLDNARNSRQIAEVLPGTPNTSVLITSRVRLSGLVISSGAEAITLQSMNKSDAAALIRSYVGAERTDAEPDAVTRLANLCASLPLALAIAAERVAANETMTIQQHADGLANRALELHVEDDEYTGVRAAFSYSYDLLNPAQSRMFRLCGLHPGPQISAASAGALIGGTTDEANQLLEQLVQFSLIEQVALHTFRLHDLLRVYAAEEAARPEWNDELQIAAQRVTNWYLHGANAASWMITPERVDHHVRLDPPPEGVVPPQFSSFGEAYKWSVQELDAIAGVAELALKHDMLFAAWRIPVEFFDFYLHHRPVGVWIDSHTVALEAAEKAGDPLRIAQAAEELAEGYLRRGSTDDLNVAWALNTRAIEVSEGGEPNRFMAFAYIELGDIEFARGRYAQAAELCERALAVARNVGARVGETYSGTQLGSAYRELGQFDLAIQHGKRSFDMLAEDQDQHGMGNAAVPLARTYRAAGHLDLALHYCEQGETAYRNTRDVQGQAEALGEKSLVLLTQGTYDEAKNSFRRAILDLTQFDLRKAAALEADWHALIGYADE